MNPRLLLPLALLLAAAPGLPAAFTAGAAVADVTPPKLPVLVNGGMLSRYIDKVRAPVQARALALGDGREQAVLVVVDSCMLPRPLLDEVKALAEKRTGIPRDRQLISATHTHSAPSAMGCLGTEPDADYLPFLRERLVEVIAAAQTARVPARIGFTRTDAAEFTALRQWIRRPDRLAEDPFGNLSVRANMHAGRNWDDVTGESGPEDPELSMISVQTREGKPLAVLANFSMHYFGDQDLSADYFGLFCEGLKARLAPGSNFVGLLSHGCSGDIYRVDYKVPADQRPNPTIEGYANGLLDLAVQALAKVEYRDDVDLAMAEARLPMNYRVPDKQRLEWAQRLVAGMGERAPKTPTEVYAREQLLLHERQKTEVVVQALRVGDIGIATTPTETYAITGLKIKAASPLLKTMVIELANGGDGYIPPPEMHAWGGYNTWAARSAGLEVQAEPKITQSAIGLLETVSGAPRRSQELGAGPVTRAVADLQPVAHWRLNEFNGPLAADASPHGRAAAYLGGVAYALDGPPSERFCAAGERNRAPHFVEGRLAAQLPALGPEYSLSLWIWNGLPDRARTISGWFYSRDVDHGLSAFGEHLGVDGSGRLIFQAGQGAPVTGKAAVPRWTWQQVVLVRQGGTVRVYLNGELEIETQAAPARFADLFFGGRSDHAASWEGRLDEIAVFGKALRAGDIQRLAKP